MKAQSILVLLFLGILFQGCNSSRDEWVKECEEILTHKNYQWINKSYCDFEGFKLTVFDECTFYEDHTCKSVLTYCHEDKAYAQALYIGEWKIEYDSKLQAYFFYEGDNLEEVRNLAMNELMFNKLDTKIRTDYYGDAYDSLQDARDSEELEGVELIDCSTKSFILKDLDSGEIQKYYRIPGVYDPTVSRDDYMLKYKDLDTY